MHYINKKGEVFDKNLKKVGNNGEVPRPLPQKALGWIFFILTLFFVAVLIGAVMDFLIN